jgi:hypothetical protein
MSPFGGKIARQVWLLRTPPIPCARTGFAGRGLVPVELDLRKAAVLLGHNNTLRVRLGRQSPHPGGSFAGRILAPPVNWIFVKPPCRLTQQHAARAALGANPLTRKAAYAGRGLVPVELDLCKAGGRRAA